MEAGNEMSCREALITIRDKAHESSREALKALVEVVETWKDHLPPAIRDGELSEALEKADAVLTEPCTNFSNYPDAESARQAWLSDKDNWDEFGSPRLDLHEWLYAPAAERKGGDDGKH